MAGVVVSGIWVKDIGSTDTVARTLVKQSLFAAKQACNIETLIENQ